MNQKTIEKTEYCNRVKAKWLLDNYHKVKVRVTDDYKFDPLTQLKKYCERVIRTDGTIKTVYKRPFGMTWGRFYAYQNNQFGGLQNLTREFRQTLTVDEYYDVDITNCQPVILEQYCKKNNIECAQLSSYVENRDEIFKTIMKNNNITRSEVKKVFLKITNGGSIPLELIDNKKIKKYHKELKYIMSEMSERETSIYNYVKHKKTGNIKGSVLSYKIQDIENDIIMSANNFLIKNGFNPDILVFDGIMVRKNKEVTKDILVKMSKHCKDETGYKVEFLIKDMDEAYNITNEELKTVNLDDINYSLVNSDHEAALKIISLLADTKDIIKSCSRYFIKIKGGIFQEDQTPNFTTVKEKLLTIIAKQNFSKKDKRGDLMPYSKNARSAKDILIFVLAEMKEIKNFYNEIWTKPLNKLCFINGYYDFNKSKFIDWEDDTQNIVTCKYIDRKYDPNFNDIEAIKWVNKNIFEAIFIDQEQRQDFKKWIARAIAGEFEEKTWAVGLGPRSCGKGVLTNIFRLAFDGYVQEFSAEQLFNHRNCSDDSAKRMGWTVPLEFARLYISNECKVEDDAGKRLKLDGNLLKTLASGGDEIKARKLFKDQTNLRLQGKMLLMMNEMVKVKPEDANETLVTFNFKTEFKNKLDSKEKFLNAVNDDYKFQLADPNIKKSISSNKNYLDAVVKIIIESYDKNPFTASNVTKQNTNEFYDNSDRLLEKLEGRFKFHATIQIRKINAITEKIENCDDLKEKRKLKKQKDELMADTSCNTIITPVSEIKDRLQDMRSAKDIVISNSTFLKILSQNGISKKKINTKEYKNQYCYTCISIR